MPKSRILTLNAPAAAGVEREEDVLGLEVAVDDALGVRGRQRAGDLPGDRGDRVGSPAKLPPRSSDDPARLSPSRNSMTM